MPIERTLKPNSVENLTQKLNQVEANGLTEAGEQIRVRVVGFIAGTLPDGTPANLVELEKTTEPDTSEISIVTDLPEAESALTGWFTKLQSQGLDPITYGNIFVLDEAGKPKEISAVTCRKEEVPKETPTEEKPEAPPAAASTTSELISEEAVKLIMESEGMDQPSRWPGGGSGITLGVGYDLGFVKADEFRKDWGAHLPKEQIDRLVDALGKTGGSAQAIASRFKDIKIPREAALAVFKARTIPKFRAQALRAFPGMDKLPPDAQGALISLVFNRGPALEGDRRREMKAIHNLITKFCNELPTKPLQNKIAEQIVEMKRLWRGKGLDGLLTRRDEEAKLVRMA